MPNKLRGSTPAEWRRRCALSLPKPRFLHVSAPVVGIINKKTGLCIRFVPKGKTYHAA